MRTFAEAREYVGAGDAWERVGAAQLAILRLNGLQPHHRVLDVGAGCLTAGHALLAYIDAGNYVALEPNDWLVAAALREVPGLADLAEAKGLCVIGRADFEADWRGPFDYVIAHSVLSHAAHWQVVQMLAALRRALAPAGQIVASLRLAPESSYARRWEYPGNSFFAWADLEALAVGCGFRVALDPEARAVMLAVASNHVHDWIVFRRSR